MKRKELKAIAAKIAKAELLIKNSTDKKIISKAENDIIMLCGEVFSLEDMTVVDEMVQEILEKNS